MRCVDGLTLAVAVALPALLAAPSLAATPIAGSRYVGNVYDDATDKQATASLVVSRDGRALVPSRRAFVAAWSPCSRVARGQDGGAVLELTSRVPIRSDGTFRFVERQGDTTLRVRGRFTRRWSVRLVARVRARPKPARRPGRPGFCRTGPVLVKLRQVGELPFRDCRPHPAEPVASGPEGRVFLEYRGRGVFPVERAYGCLFSTNRRVFLDRPDEEGLGGPRMFRLAGPYVAYVQVSCAAACGQSVYVKDLRDGAEVFNACCFERVTDLVLSPTGAITVIEAPVDPAVARSS